MKGKALRRALETNDIHRLHFDVPMITDTTEMIGPTEAQAMLDRNKHNRPINWNKVDEYAAAMTRGEWQLHAQGIVLDSEGSVLTGQKRLWAVVYSGVTVPMRVSRGSPKSTARLIDRHTPQTARDLAGREAGGERMTPTEASLARATLALAGNTKPSVDELSRELEKRWTVFREFLTAIRGTTKTRQVLMIGAAMAACGGFTRELAIQVEALANDLEGALQPQTAKQCWGKGAAFALAMRHADRLVRERTLKVTNGRTHT